MPEKISAAIEAKNDASKSVAQKAMESVSLTYLALVLSDKGGVGKTTTISALFESLREAGLQPVPMELDKGNSEIAKTYLPKDTVIPTIDKPEGFREIYDLFLTAPKDRPVVVSTPAHFLLRAQEHNPTFIQILPELPKLLAREVRPIFTLDDKRDSVNYLIEAEKHLGHSNIGVIRNNFFGSPLDFELFNASKVKKRIEEAGGQIIDFPELTSRISRRINTERWSRDETLQNLDRFDLLEYSRWWKIVCEAFRKAGYLP